MQFSAKVATFYQYSCNKPPLFVLSPPFPLAKTASYNSLRTSRRSYLARMR